MTNPASRMGGGAAIQTDETESTVSHATDPFDDLYAWSGVFLSDGRVISLAWLYGWPGAVEGWWRRG